MTIFLESVYDHPSVRIYEAKRDEANADMKITKREWLDYFRVYGQYQYGRLVQLSTRETIEDPSFLTSIGSNQHVYPIRRLIQPRPKSTDEESSFPSIGL